MVYTSTFCMWWRGAREVIKTWSGNPIKVGAGQEHICLHLPTQPSPEPIKVGTGEEHIIPHLLPARSTSSYYILHLRRLSALGLLPLAGPSVSSLSLASPSPSLQLSENLLYSFPTNFSTAFRKVSEKFPKSFRNFSEKFPKSFRKISEKFPKSFWKIWKVFANILEKLCKKWY